MATLGHVTSTALTGGDSPVFEKAGVDAVIAVGKKTDAVQEQIASLTALVTQLLAAQTAPVEPVVEVELTPQEKANITKAAKKAEAESTEDK